MAFIFRYMVLGTIVLVCSGTIFRPKTSPNGRYLTLHDLGPPKHHELLHKYFHNPSSTTCNSTSFTSQPPNSNASVPIIYVTDYGADPTGSTDSTDAFQKAISVALSYGSGKNLSYGAVDLGGATIHLGGGDYMISTSLIIPQYFGNLIIMDGTIRASKSFQPNNSYLFIVGYDNNGKNRCDNQQNACNQNIAIENMMFDCQQTCFGAINIKSTEGVVIGPQIIIIGFTGAGITVNSGHETVIFQTWLGEYLYDNKYTIPATATAIQLFGNDNTVSNTVIWSAHIGVHIADSANLLNNVHTWGTGTSHNDTGILIESIPVGKSIHSRFINCYLDYTDLVITAPIKGINIEDTYFLGAGTILLRAINGSNYVHELTILNNQYNGGGSSTVNPIIQLDETMGKFSNIHSVIIENNIILGGTGYTPTGVRASKSLTLTNSSQWAFDFKNELLFPNVDICWISYSIQINDGNNVFVQHNARKPIGTTVTIETSQNVDATVYITVDQSKNFDYWKSLTVADSDLLH